MLRLLPFFQAYGDMERERDRWKRKAEDFERYALKYKRSHSFIVIFLTDIIWDAFREYEAMTPEQKAKQDAPLPSPTKKSTAAPAGATPLKSISASAN